MATWPRLYTFTYELLHLNTVTYDAMLGFYVTIQNYSNYTDVNYFVILFADCANFHNLAMKHLHGLLSNIAAEND